MFAKTIIDSDAFLEMPQPTQLLYFHLSMRGDDDGFINKPKAIMHMVGCKEDDMKILIAKKFIIPFESGVVVVKHWRIHNYIRNDRYIETKYKEERSMLELDENSAYRIMTTKCLPDGIPMVDERDTQVRLGKDRLGEDSNNSGASPRKNFTPPTLEEVKAYCNERNNKIDAERWYDFYSSKGWMIGKNKMKDWKAAVRTWEKSDTGKLAQQKPVSNFEGRKYDANSLEAQLLARGKRDLG
jgi:hypothetical protein